jgi:hypothetical protein
LGAEATAVIRGVQPRRWYPIDMLIEPLERLDAVLGSISLRKIGFDLFRLSHEDSFRREAASARDVVFGLDQMYQRANRGTDIGGWNVLRFGPGIATIENTTPHHCAMEEGIVEAAFKVLDLPVSIYQTRCFLKGDDACEFHITSPVSDERWGGRSRSPI